MPEFGSCFYTAENIASVSGVLAVVVQGVFLSATFWPIVASRQTMEHVWHTVEWLYTT
jgi:NhaP-type Na+/H+ or K+/H+ antiporter